MSEVTSSQNVNSSNNVTERGVDYDSGPYTVTFVAGETNISFDITIANDNILEANEDFDLSIISNTLPDDVTDGDPRRVTVTIVDDDRKLSYTLTFKDSKSNSFISRHLCTYSKL